MFFLPGLTEHLSCLSVYGMVCFGSGLVRAQTRFCGALLCVAVEGCAGIVRACEFYSLLLLSDEKDLGKIDSWAFFHLSLSHQHTVSCSEEN